MKRRGADAEGLPDNLLRFRVEDWPVTSPPGPWSSMTRQEWAEVRGRTLWAQARREWARRAGSLEALNALYGPGFDPGAVPDPRRWAVDDRRLTAALIGVADSPT